MDIDWPPKYRPSQTGVHVRDELLIEAKPEAVWAWLIRAALWPTWYPNSADVTFLTGSGPDLALGTRFRWKTFGITIESVVHEFVPRERIAWDAHAVGVDAYHAWVIEPRGQQTANVLTEETQNGWLARLSDMLLPNRMHRNHQIWLEGLQERAKGGLPSMAAVRGGARRARDW